MKTEKIEKLMIKSNMGEECKRIGIKIEKITRGASVGACISIDRLCGEYYLYINLLKLSICIGWMSFEKSANNEGGEV